MEKYPEYMVKNFPKWFYKCRNGETYPYTKEEIEKSIDPFVPSTFIPILKEMNYPFIEEEWIYNIISVINRRDNFDFMNGYINKMNLFGFRNFTFKDSNKFNKQYIPIDKCKYKIKIEKIKEE